MNPYLAGNLCVLSVIAGIIAAFMGGIGWGDVVLILLGTFVFTIANGFILGRKLKKYNEENKMEDD